MFRKNPYWIAAALLIAGAAWGLDKPAPASGFDKDACVKHCKEMSESRQKMIDGRKAAAEKASAAWKEIRASVDEAKNARGEKKVAALEAALDRLVTFHEQMMAGMPGMPETAGMACCGGGAGPQPMMHGGLGGKPDCCGGMEAMADCCGSMHGQHGMGDDCPMMKKD